MVLFNYSARELTAKIVYYGPGLCGKTTNLQVVYNSLPQSVKGKMLSLSTKTDRTLFFDFLPLDLGEIAGMKTRIQLYTVPGQVFYNETRRLVLKGSDGIVFVADSQAHLLNANIESLKNLEDNLKSHGMNLKDMPLVFQFNKRDLTSLSSIQEMNLAINKYNAPFYESVATNGVGVQDTLRAITKLVLIHLSKKFDLKISEEMQEKQAVKQEALSEAESVSHTVSASGEQEALASSSDLQVETASTTEQQIPAMSSQAKFDNTAQQEDSIPLESPAEQQLDQGQIAEETADFMEKEATAESDIPPMPGQSASEDIQSSEDTPQMGIPPEETIDVGQVVEIDLSEELQDLEASERKENEKLDESISKDSSNALSAADSEVNIMETIEEEKQDTYDETIGESSEFEMKEDTQDSAIVEEQEERETITLSSGDLHEVRIPFILDVGKNKKQFHLKISFKIEEES